VRGGHGLSAGKPVAAHATTDEGARRATLAGVRTIEHGTVISPETLELMKQSGVVLVSTLAAGEAVARYAGWDGKEPAPAGVAAGAATLRKAHELGVPIACGSDAGVFAHGDNAREIELLAEVLGSPAGALRAATRDAALVLGRVVLVIQAGRVVLDRRARR